jgi:hypothetical protein
MRRIMLKSAMAAVALALTGCPVYPDARGCVRNADCAPGYACDYPTGVCVSDAATACTTPAECGVNETCSRAGRCVIGDCSHADIGCVAGYVCAVAEGTWQCIAESAPLPDGGTDASLDGGEGGSGGAAGSPSLGGAAGEAGATGGGGGAGGIGGAGGTSGAGTAGSAGQGGGGAAGAG